MRARGVGARALRATGACLALCVRMWRSRMGVLVARTSSRSAEGVRRDADRVEEVGDPCEDEEEVAADEEGVGVSVW